MGQIGARCRGLTVAKVPDTGVIVAGRQIVKAHHQRSIAGRRRALKVCVHRDGRGHKDIVCASERVRAIVPGSLQADRVRPCRGVGVDGVTLRAVLPIPKIPGPTV